MTARKQRIASLALSVSFALGTVAAPLSHYLWMGISGHYSHRHHGEMGLVHDRTPVAVSASVAHAAVCTYADLFATYCGDQLGVLSTEYVEPGGVSIGLSDHDTPIQDGHVFRLTRGPPAAH